MQKYTVKKTLGEGSFALVYDAEHTPTNTRVAIKKIKEKQKSWEGCLAMRELRSLKSLGKHPNLVALRELILEKDLLYFVFEFLPQDLHKVIQAARNTVSMAQVVDQTFRGNEPGPHHAPSITPPIQT